jgi:hypothetical protein
MTMDTNQLTQEIKNRFDHATQKKLLREKYHSKLTFAAQGGMWRAGPELLTLLKSSPEHEIVIEDLYGTPVKIHAGDLELLAHSHWQEQMNAWLVEHTALSTQR